MKPTTPKDGGAAFPLDDTAGAIQQGICPTINQGMSLRDYFAAAALQGLMASFAGSPEFPKPNDLARDAYQQADAMIEEKKQIMTTQLNKTEEKYAPSATTNDMNEQWKPIECAPKDGTEILAWIGSLDLGYAAVVYFGAGLLGDSNHGWRIKWDCVELADRLSFWRAICPPSSQPPKGGAE